MTRKLNQSELIQDGDQYLESGKWLSVAVEDIGITVSDSGYKAVRRTVELCASDEVNENKGWK
jgi:hypothetical protein